jgi:hypothetical protein
MKKVISACVDRILQFSSEHEVDIYIKQLEKRKQIYQVVWKNTLKNGNVQIRIKTQYNQSHFMGKAVMYSE